MFHIITLCVCMLGLILRSKRRVREGKQNYMRHRWNFDTYFRASKRKRHIKRKEKFGPYEWRKGRESGKIYIIITNDALHTHKVNFNESQHFYVSHKRTPYSYIYLHLHFTHAHPNCYVYAQFTHFYASERIFVFPKFNELAV